MITFPNAKINIGLHITGKRDDGYHDLATVFYPIGLADVLEVIEKKNNRDGKDITFINTGIGIDCNDDSNLVVKAYRKIQAGFSLPPVTAVLRKNIPFGAGLGGGSAEASFMLMTLNDMFSLGITETQLTDMAAQLGADCPFFIKNRCMSATGRGDVFAEMPSDFSLKGYHIVLIKPDIYISTKTAFSGIVLHKTPRAPLTEALKAPIEAWKDTVENDFEKNIFAAYPEIAAIKSGLYSLGAVYASMSGSGSSVYGIFKEEPAFGKEKFPGCFFWKGKC